jgi:hypothetical protein
MVRTLFGLCLALSAGAMVALTTTGRAQPFPVAKTVPVPVVVTLAPYIGDENVQKELKLDAAQVKKLTAGRQKMWDEAWTTAPRGADYEARNKAMEAAFKDVLSAEQLKRANQIATQILWTSPRGGGFGGFAGFGGGFGGGGFSPTQPALPAPDLRRVSQYVLAQYPAIADALKLDETQKKLAAGPPGGFGGPFASLVYLTPDQSATAKDMFGAEYKGTLHAQSDPRQYGPGGFGGPGGGGFPGGGFGLPPALQYTMAPDVQKELKLTEDQLRALAEARAKFNQPDMLDFFGTSPADRKKVQDERLAEVEKALGKVLTADQRKRLKQIERQRNTSPDVAFFPESEIAKELTVTEAQLKKYTEITAAHTEAVVKAVLSDEPTEKVRAAVESADKDRAKAVEDILTADQKTKKKDLIGEPFTGNVFAGGFPNPGGMNLAQRKFGFGRYTNQLSILVRFKGLQEELQLKDEQVKKLTESMTEFGTKFPIQDLLQALQDDEKADKLFANRSVFMEKAVADVLTKEQQARFREINLQRLEAPPLPGPGFGPPVQTTAASYPGVAEEVKLTAEQKKKLLDGTKPADVLTAEQKKAIAGMLGKPAKLDVVFAPPNFPGPGPGVPARALSSEAQLLLNTVAWDGVKLTRDQVSKLVPAANEYVLVAGPRFAGGPGGGGFPPADPKELTTAIETFEKAADAILTADQMKRLGQLAVQQTLTGGLDAALLAPRPTALTKALAPTDDQKTKITALRAHFGEISAALDRTNIEWEKELNARRQMRDRLDAAALAELTADQKAKLKELTGEPFTGFVKQPLFNFVPGGGFGGGFGGPFGP